MKRHKSLLAIWMVLVMVTSLTAAPMTAAAQENSAGSSTVKEITVTGDAEALTGDESKETTPAEGETEEDATGSGSESRETAPAGETAGDEAADGEGMVVEGEEETQEETAGETVTGDEFDGETPDGGEASEESPDSGEASEEGLTDGGPAEEDLPDGEAAEDAENAEDELTFEENSFDGASDNSPYKLVIGGVPVTPSNKDNITGGYIKSGTVSYNPDTHTLTLDNATIEVPKMNTSDKSMVAGIYSDSEEELIIEFTGTNTVTGAHYRGDYSRYQGRGIYTPGSLILCSESNGTLHVGLETKRTTADDSCYNYGIYCKKGLTIESGTVEVVTPKTKYENRGIYVLSGDFTMTGGVVTINTGDAEATNTFSAITEGIVASTCAISGGTLNITSGSVQAAGNSYQLTYGIRGSYIYISGGTVNLKAGNVPTVNTNTFAQGICSGQKLVICDIRRQSDHGRRNLHGRHGNRSKERSGDHRRNGDSQRRKMCHFRR